MPFPDFLGAILFGKNGLTGCETLVEKLCWLKERKKKNKQEIE